jgi:hypothetical protein
LLTTRADDISEIVYNLGCECWFPSQFNITTVISTLIHAEMAKGLTKTTASEEDEQYAALQSELTIVVQQQQRRDQSK